MSSAEPARYSGVVLARGIESMGPEMTRQLLFLELNEVNFESVAQYCDRGLLPNFRDLFSQHGWQTTTSETHYEHLEPWIQWVTAHTGLGFAQHGVFRLGDIVNTDLPQIWEDLEKRGLLVGAVSPMNAKCRVQSPAFFVPDPWTSTDVVGPTLVRALYKAIAQAVNDNAKSRLTARSVASLLAGIARYSRRRNWPLYWRLATTGRTFSWRKALFLDLLLTDLFVRQVGSTRPHFASLFLNAAAHIQHHYMFNSGVYAGPHRNPEWYVPAGADPVLEVYQLYDRLLEQIRQSFPEARLMIATGLHQVPHGGVTFYWRLRNHAVFLRELGVLGIQRVEERMSRDFLVVFSSVAEAQAAQSVLEGVQVSDGVPLFEIDNRGLDLFVTLTYSSEITSTTAVTGSNGIRLELLPQVAFVALKNGEHSGVGYFIDTGSSVRPRGSESFELREIPTRVLEALGQAA